MTQKDYDLIARQIQCAYADLHFATPAEAKAADATRHEIVERLAQSFLMIKGHKLGHKFELKRFRDMALGAPLKGAQTLTNKPIQDIAVARHTEHE